MLASVQLSATGVTRDDWQQLLTDPVWQVLTAVAAVQVTVEPMPDFATRWGTRYRVRVAVWFVPAGTDREPSVTTHVVTTGPEPVPDAIRRAMRWVLQ